MINRIIPLSLFLLIYTLGFSQTPAVVNVEEVAPGNPTVSSSLVCGPGETPFAGTYDRTHFPTNQSTDIQFLCFGDSMQITHLGGQDLSGDPDPTSAPGIGYIIYGCPPYITGPDFATVQTDTCHITFPSPGPNTFFIVGENDPANNGNASLINLGGYQNFFNGDSAFQFWIAPVTLNDFATIGFESDGVGGPAGPCINVNIAEADSMVYLNQLRIEDLNINAGGNGCTATMEFFGGISEWDNSNYTVDAFLISDPTIEGNFVGSFSHHDDKPFVLNAPTPGVYRVMVTDDMCGTTSIDVDLSGCTEVVFTLPNVFTSPGSNVCLDLTVDNYTDILSIQFSLEWDPTIIQYTGINDGEFALFNELNFGPPVPNNFMVVSAQTQPLPTPLTFPDGAVLFQICFDVIAPLGSSSPVEITGNFQSVEVSHDGAPSGQVAFLINQGSVTVSNIIVDLTSCSTTAAISTGSIGVVANGGDAPYTFAWEQVGMTTNNGTGNVPFAGGPPEIITPLPPGNYSITVTDNFGVDQISTIEIADAIPLVIQLTAEDPTCATDADGSLLITGLGGGVEPYSYLWSTGSTDDMTIVGLPIGQYVLTITDANGCSQTESEGLITTPVVLDTVSLIHVTCGGGGNDGSIVVEATGGTITPGSDFTYTWSDGTIGANITGLMPGNYCVTATDSNNCSDLMCFDINAPVLPIITSFDSTSVVCPNQTTGSLTVHVTPGNNVPISNYQWDPNPSGSVDSILNNIPAGTYMVTVTADDGCSTIGSATLFAPDVIQLDSIIKTRPTCPGDTDGTIQLFISGGTQPYDIMWSTGSTFPVLPALTCDSTYSVTITGANGCDVLTENIFLECPPPIGVAFDPSLIVNASCATGNNCDGGALANAFGGTEGSGLYNYRWSSGENEFGVDDGTATQLCRGWNSVTIDDNICAIIDSVFVDSPDSLGLLLSPDAITNVSCFGSTDGAVTVAATGGTPNYDYQWVNPMVTGPTITDVAAGFYSVIISDANNCTYPVVVEVQQPDPLVLSNDSLNVDLIGCSGEASGAIQVVRSGGNPGTVTYEWNLNNFAQDSIAGDTMKIFNLASGTYSITATDAKGCMDDVFYTLTEPDPIVFDVSDIVEPQCFGFQTVVTIDTAFGGNGPLYEFSVDGGPKRPINAAIPILGGRDHTILIFDNRGCSSMTEMVFVDQPAQVLVDLGDDYEIQLGDSTLVESFIGSLLPLDSVVWQPSLGFRCRDTSCLDIWVTPQEETLYELTVFDVNGCSGTDQVIVDVDKNRNVFIPNVFTPNGDGSNDLFKPFIGPGVDQILSMKVFDRWGELLFDSPEPFTPSNDFADEGWDGKLNGKAMNPGVYVYLIEVSFVDGLVLLYRGDITILH